MSDDQRVDDRNHTIFAVPGGYLAERVVGGRAYAGRGRTYQDAMDAADAAAGLSRDA